MTSIAVGNRRLLRLAKLIAPRRKYDQWMFAHDCGTPACAWGTHVYNTPRLLKLAREYARTYRLRHLESCDLDSAICYAANPFEDENGEKEFAITHEQVIELFDSAGCGGAGTDAKAAAAYIRDFVAKRQKRT